MVEPVETSLAIPSGTLKALTWGDPAGVPVLGLHGWQDNAATFTGLAPHLDGIYLVALDLPGHGRSDWRPPGMAYGFLDWVVCCFEATRIISTKPFWHSVKTL